MGKHRLNNLIRAESLRVIGPEGENMGVMNLKDALAEAEKYNLDLVEISPNVMPPIAKITDYGKFLYSENKKQKSIKSKAHTTEVKGVQVKLGTGEHDLELKSKKVSEWLSEGHRVKIDLFLPGRTKYMNENFLKERMERILKLVTVDYRVAEDSKKSLKGMTIMIEKAR